MAGIVFLKTKQLEQVRRFYEDRVGMTVWLEQPGIAILKHGNLLIGFHQQTESGAGDEQTTETQRTRNRTTGSGTDEGKRQCVTATEKSGVGTPNAPPRCLGDSTSGFSDLDGLITFFEQERGFVDRMYEEFREEASGPPKENPQYRIYHFFAQDPEGRKLEFQTFLHQTAPI